MWCPSPLGGGGEPSFGDSPWGGTGVPGGGGVDMEGGGGVYVVRHIDTNNSPYPLDSWVQGPNFRGRRGQVKPAREQMLTL